MGEVCETDEGRGEDDPELDQVDTERGDLLACDATLNLSCSVQRPDVILLVFLAYSSGRLARVDSYILGRPLPQVEFPNRVRLCVSYSPRPYRSL